MNKIEKLIKVEYRKLSELLEYFQPTKYIVNKVEKNAINSEYTIPVLTAGKTFILGWTNEKNNIFLSCPKNPAIIFDDFTTDKKWVDFDFKVKSSAIKILKNINNNISNIRYIWFWLTTFNFNVNISVHKRYWISEYSQVKIPIPPIEIQNEIVKILDNFTQLEAELEAELEARVKQYQYYRNKLLDFDNNQKLLQKLFGKDNKEIDNQISNESLGKLVIYENGKSHEYFVDDNGEYKLINSKFISSQGLIYKKTNKILTNAKKDDITMVLSDLPNGKALGKCYIVKGESIYAVNQRICKLSVLNKNKINPKFLFYVLNRNKKILDYDNKIDQTNLNKEQVLNLIIPVPSLEVQIKIVNILDKLSDYSKDIKTGLPLEIEQRQKQYKYYRNLLLDFKANAQGGALANSYIELLNNLYEKVFYIFEYKSVKKLFLHISTGKNNANAEVKDGKYIFWTCDELPKKINKYSYEGKAIIISGNGSKVGHINLFFGKFDAYQRTYVLMNNNGDTNIKFIYYYFKEYFKKYINNFLSKSGIPYITLPILQEFNIAIPSLEVQNKIVEILDKLSDYSKNLKTGLPLEIEQRQKQYKYYRDLLLKF